VADFRKCIEDLIKGGYVNSEYTFDTQIIDWKSTVDESDIRRRMSKCNVSTKATREMFNLTAPDIIQYLNQDYKKVIQHTVVQKMNEAFFEMTVKHRNYRGKVSIVAHSLGTVISYDILCQQISSGDQRIELGFQVDCFFILGSPLGLFQSVYQTKDNYVRKYIPRVKNFFNIYHP
jgi:hypothetical protein